MGIESVATLAPSAFGALIAVFGHLRKLGIDPDKIEDRQVEIAEKVLSEKVRLLEVFVSRITQGSVLRDMGQPSATFATATVTGTNKEDYTDLVKGIDRLDGLSREAKHLCGMAKLLWDSQIVCVILAVAIIICAAFIPQEPWLWRVLGIGTIIYSAFAWASLRGFRNRFHKIKNDLLSGGR